MVLDVRFLPNPHWVDELRPLTGLDAPVRDYVLGHEEAKEFVDRIVDLLELLLPAYRKEGKAYLSIAIGCTGGRHRSVAIAEEIRARLAALDTDATSPTGTSRGDGGGPRVVAIGGGHGLAMLLKRRRHLRRAHDGHRGDR